jgi:transcriptional regulator with XRE-family HTH domain
MKPSTDHRQADESRGSGETSRVEAAQPSEPNVGRIFWHARHQRRWSLREVERRTGIPNPHLSQIERGQIRRPETTIVWTLCQLYDLDFTKIAAWSGHFDRGGSIGEDTSLLLEALQALSQLDYGSQQRALRFIQRLANRPPSPRDEPEPDS